MSTPATPGARYAAALATILRSAAVPYGVTLTVWGSGAILTHFRGSPAVFEIFLFVLGGMAGYMVCTLPVTRALQRMPPASPGAQMALTGTLHMLSIGAALGVVTLVAKLATWAAWPLGGLAGIALYFVLVAVEYDLAPRLPLAREAPPDAGSQA